MGEWLRPAPLSGAGLGQAAQTSLGGRGRRRVENMVPPTQQALASSLARGWLQGEEEAQGPWPQFQRW